MGYHVAIVKTDGTEESSLSAAGITHVIRKNPAYSFDGTVLQSNGKHFLWFRDGELWMKNPNEADLGEMIALAKSLGARVRGDELETYSSAHESFIHPDDETRLERDRKQLEETRSAARKRQWILNGAVFSFFLLLIALFNALGWLK